MLGPYSRSLPYPWAFSENLGSSDSTFLVPFQPTIHIHGPSLRNPSGVRFRLLVAYFGHLALCIALMCEIQEGRISSETNL